VPKVKELRDVRLKLVRRKYRQIGRKQKAKLLSCRMVVWGFTYTVKGDLVRSLGCEYFRPGSLNRLNGLSLFILWPNPGRRLRVGAGVLDRYLLQRFARPFCLSLSERFLGDIFRFAVFQPPDRQRADNDSNFSNFS